MTCCHRCPNKPLGCWPWCEYPSASWASDSTDGRPPQWVIDHDKAMDEAAGLARQQREVAGQSQYTD
jgi:hypothetical protein